MFVVYVYIPPWNKVKYFILKYDPISLFLLNELFKIILLCKLSFFLLFSMLKWILLISLCVVWFVLTNSPTSRPSPFTYRSLDIFNFKMKILGLTLNQTHKICFSKFVFVFLILCINKAWNM